MFYAAARSHAAKLRDFDAARSTWTPMLNRWSEGKFVCECAHLLCACHYMGGGTGTGGVPGAHSQPSRQGCAASQTSPGKQAVPEIGLGEVPGVQRQPGGHVCPASQMSPGTHIGDLIGLRWVRFPYGSGDPGGAAVHPASSSNKSGHSRMVLCLVAVRERRADRVTNHRCRRVFACCCNRVLLPLMPALRAREHHSGAMGECRSALRAVRETGHARIVSHGVRARRQAV
jgi:hypothetical protein